MTNKGAAVTPSRYHPYPEYRDSGVEWLGDIPAGWRTIRAKWLFTQVNERGFENEPLLSVTQDVGVVSREEYENRVWNPGDDVSGYKLVRVNDYVISLRSFQGGIEQALIQGLVSPAYVVMRPVGSMHHGYMRYLLKSIPFISTLETRTSGIRQGKTISFNDFGELDLLIPSKSESEAIADFLDRETAHIDALIDAKKRLIDLLEEKRAALISHVVTKGLDPDAPMKESGIEWLGEIPAHWEVKKLKHLSPQVTVGIVVTPAKYYVDEGVPCLRSLNVKSNHIVDKELVFISELSNIELSKSMIFEGDLVSVRTGQPGTTAVVDSRFDQANCIDLIITRQSTLFDSAYMAYYLNSNSAHVQYGHGSDGAIQQHFNIETAKNLFVPLPPLDDQRRIVQYLNIEIEQLKQLSRGISTQIDQLQEYRTALIAAAVTGKIDVT